MSVGDYTYECITHKKTVSASSSRSSSSGGGGGNSSSSSSNNNNNNDNNDIFNEWSDNKIAITVLVFTA